MNFKLCNRIFSALLILTVFVAASCGEKPTSGTVEMPDVKPQYDADPNNTDPLLIEIRDMEMKAGLDSVMDRNVGLRLLKAYQDYYNQHPNDSLGMSCLFEASRVADAMGKYQKAVDLLVNYHDGIENINKKAESAYMVAFIYDAHMHDSKKAIEFYNRVIELYPDSPWAEQAKGALHLVGKSDEELLKFFQEKNKAAS